MKSRQSRDRGREKSTGLSYNVGFNHNLIRMIATGDKAEIIEEFSMNATVNPANGRRHSLN
jgi:hypothetical protein